MRFRHKCVIISVYRKIMEVDGSVQSVSDNVGMRLIHWIGPGVV